MSIALSRQVWQLKELKNNERVFLLALADWADDDGNGWYMIPTLAEKLDWHDATAQRHQQWATRAGHLHIAEKGNGRGHKTYFQLTLKGDFGDAQVAEKGRNSTQKGREAMQPFVQEKGRDFGEKGREAMQPITDKKGREAMRPFSTQKGRDFDRKGRENAQIPSHARMNVIKHQLDDDDLSSIHHRSDVRAKGETAPGSKSVELPAAWIALDLGDSLNDLAQDALARGWQEENLLAAYQVSQGKDNPVAYLKTCLKGQEPTAPVKGKGPEPKRSYQPQDYDLSERQSKRSYQVEGYVLPRLETS